MASWSRVPLARSFRPSAGAASRRDAASRRWMRKAAAIGSIAERLGGGDVGAGGDRRRLAGVVRDAQRGPVRHQLAERHGRAVGAAGVHGVELGEEAYDEIRPRPGRERAIEFAERGGRRLEPVDDVVIRRKSGRIRPEASPALGIESQERRASSHHPRITRELWP